MDYTLSDGYATHSATGNRLHQLDQPVPTSVTDKDLNSVLWSLMEIVKAASLPPQQFSKDTPASYKVLLAAVRKLLLEGGQYTGVIKANAGILQSIWYSKALATNAWTTLGIVRKLGAGRGRSTWFRVDFFASENGACQPFTVSGYFVDRSNTSAFADLIGSGFASPVAQIHAFSNATQFRFTDLGTANGDVYLQALNPNPNVSVIGVGLQTNDTAAIEWQA